MCNTRGRGKDLAGLPGIGWLKDALIRHRPVEETEPVTSTVDPADIRGLDTYHLLTCVRQVEHHRRHVFRR
jgi:hypothetical protein